jgi:riboflavin synthase
MFTGIITDVGTIAEVDKGRMAITCSYDPSTIAIGASIACDGCCLTVTDIERADGSGCCFKVDVSNETLSRTTLGDWSTGRRLNLERALTLQDELGGHMVSGHVDAVASVLDKQADGASTRFTIECPDDLACFIAKKGSVALDGMSLTVNEVEGSRFAVNLVPHTLGNTTWGEIEPGARINLEVDQLARYVARIMEATRA